MTLDAPFDIALVAATSNLDVGPLDWDLASLCLFDVPCFVFLPFAACVVPATVDSAQLIEIPQRLKAARLLTLTGAKGCGKTRLAIEVAHRAVEDYRDGVWLVELAPVADSALVRHRPGAIVALDPGSVSAMVTQRIAQTLGVREVGGRPLSESVAVHLGARQLSAWAVEHDVSSSGG